MGLAVAFLFVGCGFGERAHEREEDDVADGAGAGEDHGEAVDADAFAGCGWKAEGERADVVLVHLVGFVVAAVAFFQLVFEAAALVDGVVELGEGVADFEAADVELEALDPVGLVGLDLAERRDGEREVVDDRGLDEVGFGESFEDICDDLAQWTSCIVSAMSYCFEVHIDIARLRRMAV